jgi:ribosomal small subunit protein bTHX
MGRGDQRSRKGKIFAGSYGNRRRRRRSKPAAAKKA